MKLFAPCGPVPLRTELNWQLKTPDFAYCKLCRSSMQDGILLIAESFSVVD